MNFFSLCSHYADIPLIDDVTYQHIKYGWRNRCCLKILVYHILNNNYLWELSVFASSFIVVYIEKFELLVSLLCRRSFVLFFVNFWSQLWSSTSFIVILLLGSLLSKFSTKSFESGVFFFQTELLNETGSWIVCLKLLFPHLAISLSLFSSSNGK